MQARSLSSTPVHACSSSFTKGQPFSTLQWSELVLPNFCVFHLLSSNRDPLVPNIEEKNPKGIPKQEEASSGLQQCGARLGSQIELSDHLGRVIWIQGFDSRLVKIGWGIGGT